MKAWLADASQLALSVGGSEGPPSQPAAQVIVENRGMMASPLADRRVGALRFARRRDTRYKQQRL